MTRMAGKLGKTPARPGAVRFLYDTYRTGPLPTPPAVFGHQALVQTWGMLGNDSYGDCVWAGADHETLIWTAEGDTTVSFTNTTALADYAAVTGFNPADPSSDRGTDMELAAKYRRKTGVVDAAGKRHKVGAYLALSTVNVEQAVEAGYLFSAVGIGIKFPATAMDQFNAGEPWDVVAGARPDGGHYVPLVGRDGDGDLLVVTWGQLQKMTPAFFRKYCDEAIVYLSEEMLKDGKTPDGFDLASLTADLAAITASSKPTPGHGQPSAAAAFIARSWAAVRQWLAKHGVKV